MVHLTFKLLLSPKTYRAAGSQPWLIIALSTVSTVETRLMSLLSISRKSNVAADMFALWARDCCLAVALLLDTGVAETRNKEDGIHLISVQVRLKKK